ncbi:MAG: germination protein YpeB [Clostridia bacterium]|nr:germination protein YpeB [Clostridia bacterium]
MTLKRRKFIRIISYLVALCIVFAASGVFTARAKSDYESTLERVRLEGLASLAEYSREISSGLRLLAVSADDSLTDSSAYVSARAVGALGSLGCFYSEKVDNLTRFFGGVRDFSERFTGSEEGRRSAVRLSDYALEVYYHLSDLTNAVLNGGYSLTEYKSIYEKPEVPYFEDELDFFNGTEDEIFAIIEPVSSDYRNYAFLDGKDTVSEEYAGGRASLVTGIQSAIWRSGENEGEIDSYVFTCEDIRVDISRAGGVIYGIVNPQPCEAAVYSAEDALKKAAGFLETCGFENMKLIYENCGGFTAFFVFVPEINGVLLMTAEIRLEICLASGRITYLDASEYIKRYRTDIGATNGIPDVSDFLPFGLRAEKTFVCIADIKGREKLCVLAVCPYEKDKVYIFIDYYNMRTIKTLIA